MRYRKLVGPIALLAIVFAASGFQNTPEHKVLFEKAKFAMETKGDLQGAIKIFQEIIQEYPREKEYAARSQFYIGACHEKLGNAEAIKAYELVLKKYADQPELVTAARERLAALRKEKPTGPWVERILPEDVYLESPVQSPDGTMIAGVDYSKGQNLAVYDLTAKRLQLVTQFDWSEKSSWTYGPIWSPDSKEIAYEVGCWEGPECNAVELRASTHDGKSRLIYRRAQISRETGISAIDWLPDGSAIVVILSTGEKSYALGLIPATGGDFKALYSFKKNLQWQFDPVADASPDGRFIVFDDGPDSGGNDIYIISTDGKSHEVLTDHPADDRQPRWSPDGKHIVFMSQRHGGWALWGVAVKNGRPEGLPFMIKEGMQDAHLINWTVEGLGYTNQVRIQEIHIMDVDPETGELVSGPRPLDYASSGRNFSPVWSPDGKHLAFFSTTLDRPTERYVVVLPVSEGEAKKYLIPTNVYRAAYLTGLRWLSDSSGLGFACWDNQSQFSLFRLELGNGEWQKWPLSNDRIRIEWSQDGKAYLYCKTTNPTAGGEIIEHDLGTGVERSIYKTTAGEPAPAGRVIYSSDYSRLAWEAIEAAKNVPILDWKRRIVALDIQLGKAQVFKPEELGSPSFSPDGQKIVSLGSFNKNGWPTAIYISDVKSGSSKKVNLERSLPRDTQLLATNWSPDGKRIAFGAVQIKGQLMMIRNVIGEGER